MVGTDPCGRPESRRLVKIVEVVWRDAVASEHWTALEDVPKRPVRVRTVGYLWRESKAALRLLTSRTADGHCSYIVIPKKWVESVNELVAKRR